MALSDDYFNSNRVSTHISNSKLHDIKGKKVLRGTGRWHKHTAEDASEFFKCLSECCNHRQDTDLSPIDIASTIFFQLCHLNTSQ